MIIDTSAVLAVLLGEPDAKRYEDAIAAAWPRRMSTVALLEVAMVIESRGGAQAGHELDLLLEKAEIELVSVTPEHAVAARRAWRRFGKGNHPAALNFGDCFAYALARATGEPCCSREKISPTPISRRRDRVTVPPGALSRPRRKRLKPWHAHACSLLLRRRSEESAFGTGTNRSCPRRSPPRWRPRTISRWRPRTVASR